MRGFVIREMRRRLRRIDDEHAPAPRTKFHRPVHLRHVTCSRAAASTLAMLPLFPPYYVPPMDKNRARTFYSFMDTT